MGNRMAGRRVLVTSARRYMGPPIVELFAAEGASVTAHDGELQSPADAGAAVAATAPLDVLVANLATPPRTAPAHEIADEDWRDLFTALVDPLMWLVRAALPAMLERGSGKIVAITSAAPLRGLPGGSAYAAARGAQNAFVRSVGLEVARAGVQVNAIAQNYVKNNVYYPDELLADADLLARMQRAVPAGRLADGWETAELALFLASEASNFIVGQVVPFAGGWAG